MFIPSDAEGATVMLVGCPHLGGSGGPHVFKTDYDDMLAPERQRQIGECIERLAAFRPTKVAVEAMPSEQTRIDKNYRDYREGRFELTASEDHQIGFRAAAAVGLSKVFAVDAGDGGVTAGDLQEAVAFARDSQPILYERLITTRRKVLEKEQAEIAKMTVLEMLRQCNDPIALREDHQSYLLLALLTSDERFVGIDWVQGWYARNLRIYANLASMVGSSHDRVMVVIGAGHVPLLSQFAQESGIFEVQSPLGYLAG